MEEESSSSGKNGEEEENVLREAFEHVKALRKENGALRANFENLKKLHVALTESNKHLQDKCSKADEERLAIERQYQRLCESWKEEAAEKQRLLDEALSKTPQPRDIEKMRLKILEELEAPHRQKCQSLEEETERAHEGYMQANREVEALKSQLETLGGRYTKEISFLQAEHTAAIADLEVEVARLRETSLRKEDAEASMHAIAKEMAALQSERRELLAEIGNVRQEKETAVADRQRSTMDLERALHESQASSQTLRRHADNLARKSRYLEAELERSNSAAAASHDALMAAAHERDSVVARLERRVHELELDLQALQGKIWEQERNWEEERLEFGAILDDKDRLRQALMEAHEEELERQQRDAALSAAASEERHRSARSAVEGEAADLRAALQSLEESATAAETRHAEAADEARKELDVAQRDLGKARLEAQNVRRSLGEAREAAASARSDAEESRARLGDEELAHGALRQHHRECLVQISELRGESERLMERTEQLERALSGAVERAEAEQNENIAQLDAAERNWAAEKAAAVRKGADASEQERQRCKQQLHALTKRLKRSQRAVIRLAGDKQELMIHLAKAEARALASQPEPQMVFGGDMQGDPRAFAEEDPLTLQQKSAARFKAELERLRERQTRYLRT